MSQDTLNRNCSSSFRLLRWGFFNIIIVKASNNLRLAVLVLLPKYNGQKLLRKIWGRQVPQHSVNCGFTVLILKIRNNTRVVIQIMSLAPVRECFAYRENIFSQIDDFLIFSNCMSHS